MMLYIHIEVTDIPDQGPNKEGMCLRIDGVLYNAACVRSFVGNKDTGGYISCGPKDPALLEVLPKLQQWLDANN